MNGLRRLTVLAVAAGAAFLLGTAPVLACGFLVAPNGTVQLVRTTTLAAYHDGVEHYVTSFEYAAGVEEFGSIVPLPGIPTKVERGGDWTLQRLNLEFPPTGDLRLEVADVAAYEAAAQVILETQIDALDIVVLEGGAAQVVEWAAEHGYFLPDDAEEVLAFYADRSPYFMAARFDGTRAQELGQNAGDGTPIHLTIPTESPWVPLHILAMAKPGAEIVEADIYLLTDESPSLLYGGKGVDVVVSEAASPGLLDDLRSDEGMEWVPGSAWVTKIELAERADRLNYDLAVGVDGQVPSAVDAGLSSWAVATLAHHDNVRVTAPVYELGLGPKDPAAPAGENPWLLAPLLGIAVGGIGLLLIGPVVVSRQDAQGS